MYKKIRWQGKCMSNQIVQVIMTCYNRKEDTLRCIQSLVKNNFSVKFIFTVVDDNSTDGTKEALMNLPYFINVVQGNGHLYWNGGMYRGIAEVMKVFSEGDYILLVNDDVNFFLNCVDNMIEQSKKENNAVIVGTIVDSHNATSYGGVKFTSKRRVKYSILEPYEELNCDTFNANCVLLPAYVVKAVGNLDPSYKHAMGDFDYGMTIVRKGYAIHHTPYYVGRCDDNILVGTWRDTTLSRRERINLKESVKGLPAYDWFHFTYRNFGLFTAIYHTITSYVRIILRK